MTSGQKVAFSLLISVLAFCAFTVIAFSGLFDILEVNFYQPVVQKIKQEKIEEIGSAQKEYFETLIKRFDDFSVDSSVKTYIETRPDDSAVREREAKRVRLFTETSALKGIRIVDSNARNVYFSTFSSDIISTGSKIAYRDYNLISDEVSFDSVKSNPNVTEIADSVKKCRLIKDADGNRVIFSIPFFNKNSVSKASILFYCDPANFSHFLFNRNLIDMNGFASLVTTPRTKDKKIDGFGGFVFGLPNYGSSSVRDQIIQKWRENDGSSIWKLVPEVTEKSKKNDESGEINEISENIGEKSLCAFSSDSKDFGYIAMIFDESELKFPPFMRILLLVTAFVTFYLAVFLILSFKHDDMIVIRDKIERYQNEFFIAYKKKGEPKNESYFAEQKNIVEKRVLKSLGKKVEKHAAEFKSIFDSHWAELLSSFGFAPLAVQGGQGAINADELKKIVRSSLEDILENGTIQINATTVAQSQNLQKSRVSPQTENSEKIEKIPESVSEINAPEPVEEILEAESLGEVEEISESVEDAETLEELDEIEPVEEAESVEELDEVESAEEIEADEPESIEEVESVEEIPEAESLGEVEEIPESIEEVTETEVVEVAENLEEPEEIETIEEVESVEEISEAESLDEVEEISEAVEESESVENAEEVSELDEVEEVESVEEVTETEVVEDVENLEEPEEIEPVEEADELEAAESLGEVEEISESVENAEELSKLDEVESAEEIEADEPEPIEEVESVEEIENAEPIEEVESAEEIEAESLGEVEEISEPVDETDSVDEVETVEEVESVEEIEEAESVEDAETLEESDDLDDVIDSETLQFGDGRENDENASQHDDFSATSQIDSYQELDELDTVDEEEAHAYEIKKTLDALPDEAPKWTNNDEVELDSEGLSRKLSYSEEHDIQKLKDVAKSIEKMDAELDELETLEPSDGENIEAEEEPETIEELEEIEEAEPLEELEELDDERDEAEEFDDFETVELTEDDKTDRPAMTEAEKDVYKDEILLEKIEFGVPLSEGEGDEQADDSVAENFVAAAPDYSFLDDDDTDEKMYAPTAQTDIKSHEHFFENPNLNQAELLESEEVADTETGVLESDEVSDDAPGLLETESPAPLATDLLENEELSEPEEISEIEEIPEENFPFSLTRFATQGESVTVLEDEDE